MDEIKNFIKNVKPLRNYEERLFTIVTAQISSTFGNQTNLKGLIHQFVAQYRGTIIQYLQGSFVATFEGPSKAVHCCMDLAEAIQRSGAKLAVGVHIKEAAVTEAHSISRETQDFIDTIYELAKPNQILITQTVKNLLSGAGLNFHPYKSILESKFGEPISLFEVTDHLSNEVQQDGFGNKQLPRNDSFLENVLQIIDAHLEDESFSVDMLCREIGISERQLQRKLKAITNKSPIQLISSVRLHRAKELLLGSENNITEIAFQTGFSNPSYFSKRFKEEFRISPSTFLQNQS